MQAAGWARSMEWRAVARLPLPPIATGLLLFVALIGAYVLTEWLVGGADAGAGRAAGPFTIDEIGFAVGAGVSAYALAAGALIAAGNRADVSRLREHGAISESVEPTMRAGRIAGGLGLVAAVIFTFNADEAARDLMLGRGPSVDGVLSLGVLALAFWLSARASWFTLAELYAVAQAMGRGRPLDPLATAELEPLGRMALRAAVLWAGAAALGALSLVLTQGAPAEFIAVSFLLAVAAGSFWIPVWGVHRNLRAAKRAELVRVRSEIRRDREALADLGPDSGAAAQRLPGLLAFEARMESAREWPFDASTLRRFGIILLLPLLSWLGGALVERGVDRLLD
ncbi:MAG: hypothetical protein QNK05_24085 [Myxococcota bacterium]|nr:hypothetical protein [Myxococcota bacterium]